ncbi:MAG: hypothetical protein PVH61_04380 [Candidatus Aminicenantes bacterium]|jgi:hypothetical protein
MSQKQSNERKFRINVENLFDLEKRKIKVKHNKKDAPVEEVDIDFPDGVVQQAPKNRKKFELSSEEHLEISLGDLGGSESSYWFVTLPFVADFKFLSESGNEVPLIYEVLRNESTGGRTVVKIPTEIDPTACKLRIAPPGRLEENYQIQNLTGELAALGGKSSDDSVTIGDNGP